MAERRQSRARERVPAKVDIHMPIFIGDYLRDTGDLTTEEHGAYFLLLMAMWTARGSLPLARLYLFAKVPAERWDGVWATLERFFDVEDGRVGQRRLSRELDAAVKRVESARENGRLGGRPAKSANPGVTHGLTGGLTDGVTHDQTESQPSGKAKPNPIESSSSASGSLSEISPILVVSDLDQTRAKSEGRAGIWSVWDWRRKYGLVWCEKYGGTAIGGDGAADGKLGDKLASLPVADLLAAQARAPEMFREFLATAGEAAEARHRWSWFVGRWDSLRVPVQATRSTGPSRYADL